jgi:hypothetical protein
MVEGRLLKKSVSTSTKLAELTNDSARLLYTWLIPHLDVNGRFYADPGQIKTEIVPRLASFTVENVQAYLEDMQSKELLVIYERQGKKYLQVKRFNTHQKIDRKKEAEPTIPAPPQTALFSDEAEEKKKDVSAATSLLREFREAWSKKGGKPYAVTNFGMEGKLANSLLKIYSLDELVGLIKTFFATEDAFWDKTGRTFGIFKTAIPKLLLSKKKNQTPLLGTRI